MLLTTEADAIMYKLFATPQEQSLGCVVHFFQPCWSGGQDLLLGSAVTLDSVYGVQREGRSHCTYFSDLEGEAAKNSVYKLTSIG